MHGLEEWRGEEGGVEAVDEREEFVLGDWVLDMGESG
jgi:hypothetical protein